MADLRRGFAQVEAHGEEIASRVAALAARVNPTQVDRLQEWAETLRALAPEVDKYSNGLRPSSSAGAPPAGGQNSPSAK